ncbi:hypothetical protein XFF6994_5380007 [Xanthomonas citri pv. fuscans]|nr:hypothetical protein XFF6994_5380007 [Xanthomonas citri pv. fuscans]
MVYFILLSVLSNLLSFGTQSMHRARIATGRGRPGSLNKRSSVAGNPGGEMHQAVNAPLGNQPR